MNEKTSLDKMGDKFDTDFEYQNQEKALVEIKTEIEKIEVKKNELVEKSNDSILYDQYFIREELKTLMDGAKSVLKKLEADIKIGSAARTYEVYARLIEAVTGQYRELRELNRDVAMIQIEKGKFNPAQMSPNDTIALKPGQLLELIENAKKNSEINKIDATFDYEEN